MTGSILVVYPNFSRCIDIGVKISYNNLIKLRYISDGGLFMPLKIVRHDITKMQVDAIVSAADESLIGEGGVCGAIHRAAGVGLRNECAALGGCEVGEVKITGGYYLPVKYVIHTVGPIYVDGKHAEAELLESCYRKSLALAKEYGCETLAFPLISAGTYGYPADEALRVATQVICDFLLSNEMTVYIVVYDRASYKISEKLFFDVQEYIDDNYVEGHADSALEIIRKRISLKKRYEAALSCPEICESRSDLEIRLKQIDESFTQMLLRKIDEKGMTDVQCYKKANINRKLFSKIRSDIYYRPSKPTTLAFAIALELSLSETEDMLRKAGFALSHSNKFDIIVEYFIRRGNYSIFEINEALFAFDQSLLGG